MGGERAVTTEGSLIAAGAVCRPGCAAAASGAFTAVSGGDLGDVLKAAAVTYVSVRAFAKVDSAFKGAAPTIANRVGRSVAHGAVGGLAAKASGGQFRHGFLATAVTQFAAPSVSKIGSRAGREFALAALGGAAAELGGGKFANGARTAAYLSLFSWAAEHYENTVGWAADPSPGGRLPKTGGKCCHYKPTGVGPRLIIANECLHGEGTPHCQDTTPEFDTIARAETTRDRIGGFGRASAE